MRRSDPLWFAVFLVELVAIAAVILGVTLYVLSRSGPTAAFPWF